MSAVEATPEPSMEEILSSIREAINDDGPASAPGQNGDPFVFLHLLKQIADLYVGVTVMRVSHF